MIRTSYRGPVRLSVFHCVRRTQRAPDRGAARSQGARTSKVKVKRKPEVCFALNGVGNC
ncbi:unnamed protein product [Staurois parvus]|uniref:Uncharacterized protein n=1 Tax=Staurois parvus TaxID=386267 RepID=A0ABN9GVR6_9NEOB|nr:unnamed protein product [Staurois parvus]